MPHYLRSMSQKAFKTFRRLAFLTFASLFSLKIFVYYPVYVEIVYSFAFLFGMLTFIHGFQVWYLIVQEENYETYRKRQDMIHRKLYKALERLEDIENR